MPTLESAPKSQLLGWSSTGTRAERGSVWREFVTMYSSRSLSHVTDRLPAISALAQAMEHQEDNYVCGLWESDLICQLMWRVTAIDDLNESPVSMFDTYIAPTWSWASHTSGVHYDFCKAPQEGDYSAKVVKTHATPTGIDPYGAVTSGYIVLRGILAPAVLSTPEIRRQREISQVHLKSGERVRMGSHWASRSSLDALPVMCEDLVLQGDKKVTSLQRAPVPAEGYHRGGDTGEVMLFWLTSVCIMVLSYSKRQRGSFERLGIILCDNEDSIPEWLHRVGWGEVVII